MADSRSIRAISSRNSRARAAIVSALAKASPPNSRDSNGPSNFGAFARQCAHTFVDQKVTHDSRRYATPAIATTFVLKQEIRTQAVKIDEVMAQPGVNHFARGVGRGRVPKARHMIEEGSRSLRATRRIAFGEVRTPCSGRQSFEAFATLLRSTAKFETCAEVHPLLRCLFRRRTHTRRRHAIRPATARPRPVAPVHRATCSSSGVPRFDRPSAREVRQPSSQEWSPPARRGCV